LDLFGLTIPCYAAIIALVLNVVVAYGVSFLVRTISNPPVRDETLVEDYL
jgi:SSS family solute:Na+ symporter